MSGDVHRVVVGFDGSPHARDALDWGIREASLWKASLQVLVAVGDVAAAGTHMLASYEDWARACAAQADKILTTSRSGLAGCDVVVAAGDARATLTAASAVDSIVVVGSLGHGVVSGALLGSVSQHLAHHATGPVVVVRGDAHDGRRGILVGVDGSPESERALEFGLARAATAQLPLEALYARPVTLARGTPLAVDVTRAPTSGLVDTERWLAEAVAGYSTDYPDVIVERSMVLLEPVPALAGASATAGLLVVGSRGRGTVAGALLGSVSQGLLRQARCPVAVIR